MRGKNLSNKELSKISLDHEKPTNYFTIAEPKTGRYWVIGNVPNAADYVFVESAPPHQGFGGATQTYIIDNGDNRTGLLSLRGPWWTDAEDLYNATGYDIRDKHLTYGVVYEERIPSAESPYIRDLGNVLHQDEYPQIGVFERIEGIARELQTRLRKPLFCYTKALGGSSDIIIL